MRRQAWYAPPFPAEPFCAVQFCVLNGFVSVWAQFNSAKRSISGLRATLSRQGSGHSKLDDSEKFEPELEPEPEPAIETTSMLSPATAGSQATPTQSPSRRVRTIGSV